MNTTELLIDNTDLELAQNIGKFINDKTLRSKAIASVFAVNIAGKFFDTEKYDIDTISGLHNIPNIHSDIDISDLYINSNYIDVRIFFEEDSPSIPCSLLNNGVLPVAFCFLKINSELSNAEVIGFIRPEDINHENIYENQFIINESDLYSFYDIEPYLINNEEFIEIEDTALDDYLMGKIPNNDFFNKLTKSKDARLKLAKLAKAQYIFNFISLSDGINNKEINDEVSLDLNDSISDMPDFNIDIINSENDDLDLNSEDNINFDSDIVNIEETNDLDLNSEDNINFDSDIVNIEENNDLNLNSEDNINFDSDIVNIEENNDLDLNSEDNINFDSDIVNVEESNDLELNSENDVNFDSDIVNIEESNDLDLNSEDDINFDNHNDEMINEDLENLNRDNFSDYETSDYMTKVSTNNDTNLNNYSKSKELNQNEFENNTINNPLSEKIEKDSNNDFKTIAIPNSLKEENILDELENSENNDNSNSIKNDTFNTNSENNKEIESLFGDETLTEDNSDTTDNTDSQESIQNKRKSSKLIPVLGLITLVGGLSYLIYSKIVTSTDISNNNTVANNVIESKTVQNKETNDAMPIESVETTQTDLNDKNEGVGTTVPAIEQNLDASVLVSNLKVDWEVPAGYASNTSAKRYLIKLGKILQLNLKTELLLLSKPPITNKIGVEIKFNENTKKFETVGITISSGEESVDNIILNTVKTTLSMNLSANTNSFNKLQGNPVLIIHL